MSDSYPMLAVSGYAPMEWKGRGSLNETSGWNRTPNSLDMFAATTKGSFLVTRIEDTCDILEEAVNLAFEGRPGPVHITVPENLTHRGEEVENYHDVRLEVAPVDADPDQVERAAEVVADAIQRRQKVVMLVGFGAIRSHAEGEVKRFIERFQTPLLTTLDGKGIVSEGHPLCVGVFSDSGHSSAWKAFRQADVVLAVGNAFNQHATFNYRDDLFTDKTLIHINISATEIDKAYKADHALVSDARSAMAALYDALDRRVGEVEGVTVDGQDWE
jgi:acetolactate synthase-1/2/3 large subunit